MRHLFTFLYLFTTAMGFTVLAQVPMPKQGARIAAVSSETFTYSGSIETWKVPTGVTSLTIEARGAEGGNNTDSDYRPGKGAIITGVISVTPGQKLKILVGQQPQTTDGNGGGGGSFVVDNNDNPLVIAGGGGGSGSTNDANSKQGQATMNGGAGAGNGGAGGTNGSGGLESEPQATVVAAGGGGLLTNGGTYTAFPNGGGKAYVNNGKGGTGTGGASKGGYGGGGIGSSKLSGGGGGGYSGGGGGGGQNWGPGGGGGSYNSDPDGSSLAGANTSDGLVILRYSDCAPYTVSINDNGSLTCSRPVVRLTVQGGGSGATYVFSGPNVQSSGPESRTAAISEPGTYTVMVTNSLGCPASATTTIESNTVTPRNVELIVSNELTCTQITATLSASSNGGTTYVISGPGNQSFTDNTAVVSQAGEYTVVATRNNGCSAIATTTVISNTTSPAATLTNSGPITANQPTVTLTAGGGNNYAFSSGAAQQGVGNTATVTTPGQYQVTVTNSGNGCSAIASTIVTGAISGSSCRNGSGTINVIASGNPVKYEWYRNSINSARLTENPAQVRGTSTASLTLVNQQVTADYYVRVTNANGSAVVYGPFRFTVNLGCNIYARTGAEEVELKISLLGNPIQGEQLRATVQGAAGKALNVRLLDMSGKPIRQQFWQQAEPFQSVEWNMTGQPSGMYLLQANTEANTTSPAQQHNLKVIKP